MIAIDRPHWLRLLAISPYADLARLLIELGPLPPFEYVREPEVGLAMVRGRAGGDGVPFNLGEMTVTRCRLRVTTADAEERVGAGCVAGRAPRHAEAIALCDALLQSSHWHDTVVDRVLEPAGRALDERRARNARRRAATKADFVTVVRSGES
jgi:alpha-D-ribose 1-methylphosphonate 5-triphosphate synthase subunit PhnG